MIRAEDPFIEALAELGREMPIQSTTLDSYSNETSEAEGRLAGICATRLCNGSSEVALRAILRQPSPEPSCPLGWR